jgi:protein-disulfide isomerase
MLSRFGTMAIAAAVTFSGALLDGQSPDPGLRSPVVAVVGSRVIRLSDVDEAASGRLLALRNQEYTVRRQQLQLLIDAALLELEAERRSVKVSDLLKTEVEDMTPAVTAAEAQIILEANPSQASNEKAVAGLQQRIRQQRIARRRSAFLESLRARASVNIALDPVRIAVEGDPDNTRVSGPLDAPVTIVEFSDFQCPFCAKMLPVLSELRARYGESLRLEFRDLPVVGHPFAERAAEAGRCAGAQGKFWQLHDALFRQQQQLSEALLPALAREAGLDVESFDACLASGVQRQGIDRDKRAAERLGINGTPAFFVNGRALFGAVPLDGIVTVIEEELHRSNHTNR